MKKKILKFVIDGGPCSGKSTGIPRMAKALREKGYIALIVPEAAATLIKGGISPKNVGMYEFQKANYELQVFQENLWMKYAEHFSEKEDKDVVILCDRAKLSGEAYLPEFFELLSSHYGVQAESLLMEYVGVIHLVTAADGAEEFYTCENEDARDENLEGARRLCPRSYAAWRGHPNRKTFGNLYPNGDKMPFDEKLELGIQGVFDIIEAVMEQLSTEEIELESKGLITEDEYMRMVAHIGSTVGQAKEQVNSYFDTEDLKLYQNDLMLRSRQKKGQYELTLKESAGDGRKETNHRPFTDVQIKDLYSFGIIPEGNVCEALERLQMNPPFMYHGELITNRIEIQYKGCKLALDHNTYLGFTDYEIEVEKEHSEADEKQVLADFLAELKIPHRPAIGKSRRFFEAKKNL